MIALQRKFPCREDYFQLFSHPYCLLHEVGPGHPETPARLARLLRGCAALPPELPLSFQVPPAAQPQQLQRVHAADYLAELEDYCRSGHPFFMSYDNHICGQTFTAVLGAGGCALALAETLLAGGAGFALVRPPGHHAGARRAEGFCFINHTALVIETIRLLQPLARFLAVDFDVHHGNGLDRLYYNDPQIFYYSLHGEPPHIFPNTGYAHEVGDGAARGCSCNVTLPLDCSGESWLQQFASHLGQVEKRFRADYLLVNAGFDAHRDDPLGPMAVEDRHYLAAIQQLQDLARRQCAGRIGLFLEGGYSLDVLQRLVPKAIEQLAINHE